MVVLVIFRFKKCITFCPQCNTKINSSVLYFCFPFCLNWRVPVDFNHKEESCFDFLYLLLFGKMHCGNPIQNLRNKNAFHFSDCNEGGVMCEGAKIWVYESSYLCI